MDREIVGDHFEEQAGVVCEVAQVIVKVEAEVEPDAAQKLLLVFASWRYLASLALFTCGSRAHSLIQFIVEGRGT